MDLEFLVQQEQQLLILFLNFEMPIAFKILFIILGFGSFAMSFLFAMCAIENRLPEVDCYGEEVDNNPMHLLFKPDLLTEKGNRYRRLSNLCLGLFFLIIVSGGFLM